MGIDYDAIVPECIVTFVTYEGAERKTHIGTVTQKLRTNSAEWLIVHWHEAPSTTHVVSINPGQVIRVQYPDED